MDPQSNTIGLVIDRTHAGEMLRRLVAKGDSVTPDELAIRNALIVSLGAPDIVDPEDVAAEKRVKESQR